MAFFFFLIVIFQQRTETVSLFYVITCMSVNIVAEHSHRLVTDQKEATPCKRILKTSQIWFECRIMKIIVKKCHLKQSKLKCIVLHWKVKACRGETWCKLLALFIDLKHSAPSSSTRNADILQRPIIFAGVRGIDDRLLNVVSLPSCFSAWLLEAWHPAKRWALARSSGLSSVCKHMLSICVTYRSANVCRNSRISWSCHLFWTWSWVAFSFSIS